MSEFSNIYDGHVRLAILRLLDSQPGYCANDSVLATAVHYAVWPCILCRLQETQTLMLLRGADVDMLDSSRTTALMFAARNGRSDEALAAAAPGSK